MSNYGKALVLGFGDSGTSAAKLLLSEGTQVTIVDRSDSSDLKKKCAFVDDAEVILGCKDLPENEFDVCIVSPGISRESLWIKDAESRMPVMSELELGSGRCKCPIIAVTGSNGKSTMVKLCSEAINLAGMKSEIAGNYGRPVCDVVSKSASLDWLVVEVSSFQLETTRHFSPRLRILLNVQPDHLDRHESLESYRNLKLQLFKDMKEDDVAIVLESELSGVAEAAGSVGKLVSFGTSESSDYRYSRGSIDWVENGKEMAIDISGCYFDNPILGLSAAASVAVLRSCGLSCNDIHDAISDFCPLPHRMEEIATVDGVRFVNDSKATNLTAMVAGIEMSKDDVRLIAGGQLKEKTSPKIKEVLAKCVKSIYLIGEASEELNDAWSDSVECKICYDLQDAVISAKEDASAGDVVLLSPGCASFDQFQNYKDRGNQFKEIVKKEI